MDKSKTLMFMAHMPVADISNAVSVLLEYQSVEHYIVAAETKPYEHLHFLVEMNTIDYGRYSKRLFRDKYKLRGQAGRKGTPYEGIPRQYGKIHKDIKNIFNACCYTVKDGNYQSNLPEETVLEFLKHSFEKADECPVEIAVKNLEPSFICTEYEYDKSQYQTVNGAGPGYYENDKEFGFSPGNTLGDIGDFRRNFRKYAAKIYETTGPVENFRKKLICNCYKYKRISTEDLMIIMYRL